MAKIDPASQIGKRCATFGGLSTVQQVRYRGLRALAKVLPFLRWEPERSGVADIIPALLLLTLDIDRR
jgi:hypothetical protein